MELKERCCYDCRHYTKGQCWESEHLIYVGGISHSCDWLVNDATGVHCTLPQGERCWPCEGFEKREEIG